jgi:small-conductance mechanosensitive channel
VIEPLANALARPVTISYATSPKKKLSATGRQLEENALARDFADTVATLMRLEETLKRKLSKVTEADSSPASIASLRRRLHTVQNKIENAEEPFSNCDAEKDRDCV